jgi:hypothetical protein
MARRVPRDAALALPVLTSVWAAHVLAVRPIPAAQPETATLAGVGISTGAQQHRAALSVSGRDVSR